MFLQALLLEEDQAVVEGRRRKAVACSAAEGGYQLAQRGHQRGEVLQEEAAPQMETSSHFRYEVAAQNLTMQCWLLLTELMTFRRGSEADQVDPKTIQQC